MALVEPRVTASPKKTMPESAKGSLFRAPTMLYVVELVARMHQAVVYEMKTAHAPEKIMAENNDWRVSGGKFLLKLAALQSSAICCEASVSPGEKLRRTTRADLQRT